MAKYEKVFCFHCEAEIRPTDLECPHCGRARTAPPCPQCRHRVTQTMDQRIYFPQENGRYPWHRNWDGRCENCGLEFVARLRVAAGHHTFHNRDLGELAERARSEGEAAFAGQSRIEIRGGESVHMECDDWNYQPTIEVRIEREAAANFGVDEGLAKEVRFEMTAEEWRAVIDHLQGPLRVLLERKSWSRDTT